MTSSISLTAALTIVRITHGSDAEAALLQRLRRGELPARAEAYEERPAGISDRAGRKTYNVPLPSGFWFEVCDGWQKLDRPNGSTQGWVNWEGAWAQYVGANGVWNGAMGIFLEVSDLEAQFPLPADAPAAVKQAAEDEKTSGVLAQLAREAFVARFPDGDPGRAVLIDYALHDAVLAQHRATHGAAARTWSVETSKRAAGRRK